MKKAVENEQNLTPKISRNAFASSLLSTLVFYVGVTLLLNAIRTGASLWIVWPLIVIQLLLYFWIFVISSIRFKQIGYKRFNKVLFIVLAVLGRVENWEIVIIPSLIVIMLILSARNSIK